MGQTGWRSTSFGKAVFQAVNKAANVPASSRMNSPPPGSAVAGKHRISHRGRAETQIFVGAELARDADTSLFQTDRVIVHREQALLPHGNRIHSVIGGAAWQANMACRFAL